jgi:hypothetical protein
MTISFQCNNTKLSIIISAYSFAAATSREATSRDTHPNLASKLTIWQPNPEHQQNSSDIKE